jgi:hypothetical protein
MNRKKKIGVKNREKAISIAITATMLFLVFGMAASATVDWIAITAVDDKPVWYGYHYGEVSHSAENITFTVHTDSSGKDMKANVTDEATGALVKNFNAKKTDGEGNATFKWENIPANLALGNYRAYGFNATDLSDVKEFTAKNINTAPVITAIHVQDAAGWHNLSAGDDASAKAGDTINVSVNVTDADGKKDLDAMNVKVNMTAFNPSLTDWTTLAKASSDTNWAVYNGSVVVKKFVGSTGLQITANATDSKDAFKEEPSVGELIVIPAKAYNLKIFGPDTSAPGGNSINQTVAIQDTYGNNLTKANGTFSYTVTMTSTGDAVVKPPAKPEITEINTTTEGIFNTTFEIDDETDESIQVKVRSTGLQSAEKTLTYYGSVHHLDVSLNKTSMYANDGEDAILATVQLKDSAGRDLKSEGVQVVIMQDAGTPPGLFDLGTGTDLTDANGKATFVISSTKKSGSDKIIATAQGKEGVSGTVTVTPIVNPANCIIKPDKDIAVKAGESVSVNVTTKDYDNKDISGIVVTFNITSGNGTLNGVAAGTPVTATSGSLAEVTFVCTKAGDVNKINATVKDIKGVSQKVQGADIHAITIVPNEINKFAVSPSASRGLPNLMGAEQEFTIQLKDEYTNNNETGNVEILITTDNPALGNMTNGTIFYNENIITTTNATGAAKFTYTVNTTEPGTAKLALNATAYTITGEIMITTSGPGGIALTFNKTLPLVGKSVQSVAQLTDPQGNTLGIADVVVTFAVKGPGGELIDVNTDTTNSTGIALYTFSGTTYGAHTVTATNDTFSLSDTNTTTFVGSAVALEVSANNTAPMPNETISVNATFKDAQGYVTSSQDGGTVRFLKDSYQFDTGTISNGVATVTYTQAASGTVELTAFYNATLQDSITVEFGEAGCPWDLNGDETVNILDLVILTNHWGEDWSTGDFNNDNTINILDVVILTNHWGACPA